MIYVPEISSDLCYLYDIQNGLLKSYSITEYSNLPEQINVTFIYEDRHYRSEIKEVPLNSLSSQCLDNVKLTTEYFYRNDIIDILTLVLLFCVFIIYPSFYLLGRLSKKYFR